MGKNKKGFTTLVICLVTVAIAATSTGAAVSGDDAIDSAAVQVEESTSVLVKTESPAIGDITLTSEYIGKVEPGQQTTVYPKAAGEVLAAHFKVGDTVAQGDVLCELDSTTLQTTISQTQAAVAAAQAKAQLSLAMAEENVAILEFNVEKGHDNTLKSASAAMDNAQAAVDSAENRLQTANANLSVARRQLRDFRDDDIYPISLTSMQGILDEDQVNAQLRDAVVQAELAVEAAQLGLEQAQSGLKKAQDGYKTAKVMVQEQQSTINKQVEMAKLNTNFNDQYIAIQKLQNDLDNYKVTAPISGIIEQRNIDPHDMASPQSPVYVISNKDTMMVTFNVPADASRNLQIGDSVNVSIASAAYTGSVTEIGTKVNAVGLFPVKVQLNGDSSSLMTGLTVTVAADTQHTRGAVTLPLSYVYFKDNAAYVYAVEDGIAVKTPIETGLMDDDTVEVLSGINTATQVISTWSPDLKDGVPVEVAQGE